MGDTSRDPVDYHRTTRPHAGEAISDVTNLPGLVLVGTGVVAMAICVAAFAMGQVGVGIAAVVVALLASAAGMAWLAAERRRVRDIERRQLARRSGDSAAG
ncbi:hypothetical protein [Mycobacterium xenopi]|uniref:UsfY protein n=1 Tax=Mycobacterium xenopi TaxID=1789 RepID=A0AAD1M197_MYCXE|nr:hypothetical protein [Mycobacterium xenopi]EID16525.1 UsfY protein [Mycobacterium xenopi RIVM700367]MDA3641549.1 LapA family protein [Mycobacterium xenopi]MDA3659530.1 LapA family protein [Mycobacterium xenopi]MDA3664583.1 LapA family protein [Mycobacterium xenopi]ORX21092.1 hypothetical protein AWC32_02280 [Mycobacterium xenopi]